MLNWDKFDDFFNGCLMRRPQRRFSYSDEYGVAVSWAGEMGHYVRARDAERKFKRRVRSGKKPSIKTNLCVTLPICPRSSRAENGYSRSRLSIRECGTSAETSICLGRQHAWDGLRPGWTLMAITPVDREASPRGATTAPAAWRSARR